MLFTRAFTLTSTVDARACRAIGDASHKVVTGEWTQASQLGNVHRTETEYMACIMGKTAALTECSTWLGAHYSGVRPRVTTAMAEYGANLGIAFQIADDVLDLAGDPHTTGKTLGTDLLEKNYTLPVLEAMKQDPTLRMQMESLNAESIRRRVLDAGGVAMAEHKARAYAAKARDALLVLPDSPARRWLAEMVDWAVERKH
jgi:octaprenyl-diphosphate synthase